MGITGGRFGLRSDRNRLLGMVVAAGAAVVLMSASALTSQAGASSCPVSGHLLLSRAGVVVWTAHRPAGRFGNEGSVYMCASPSGRSVLLQSTSEGFVSDASVTQLRFAGDFVGFFLRTNVEVYSKFLVVFDRVDGRIQVMDLAECDYNDECTGPDMTAYRLAPDGWVAELWPLEPQGLTGLLATNGGGHYQLDLARLSTLKLSHGTLSWTSPFGAASVKLGPSVITQRTPRKLSACRLLTAAELAAVLGPGPTSSSSTGKCTYASTKYSGRTLTLKLKTGMSHAQMRARERALTNAPYYCTMGEWWPQDDNFYDLEVAPGDFCGSPVGHVRFVIFANGSKVSLNLTTPSASGAEQVAHLANVAVDRLFGVPIHRAFLAAGITPDVRQIRHFRR